MFQEEIIDSFLTAIAERMWKTVQHFLEMELDLGDHCHEALFIACSVPYKAKKENIHFKLVNYLLNNGASPNCIDERGRTPIMTAIRRRVPKSIVQLLLLQGANPNICDQKGLSTFDHLKPKYWPVYYPLLAKYRKNGENEFDGTNYLGITESTPLNNLEIRNRSKNEYVQRNVNETSLIKSQTTQLIVFRERKRHRSYPISRDERLEPIPESNDNINDDDFKSFRLPTHHIEGNVFLDCTKQVKSQMRSPSDTRLFLPPIFPIEKTKLSRTVSSNKHHLK